MKKSLILSLVIFPTLFSCNQSHPLEFTNPFPNDDYLSQRIGFRLSDDETPIRQLTQTEIEVIKATQASSEVDKYINKKHGFIHERSYKRAFAGEFKQGYDISNELSDIEETVYTNGITGTHRLFTVQKTNRTLDYSYGSVTRNNQINKSYLYLCDYNSSSTYQTDIADSGIDPITSTSMTRLAVREIEEHGSYKSYEDTVDVDTLVGADDPSTYEPKFLISQNEQFMNNFNPDDQAVSGATEDHIVMWNSVREPGEYVLKDGTRYKSSTNTLVVTKAKLIPSTPSWYLVDYARVYTEQVITSDVIQPNIPETKIPQVLIYFKEEKYSFSNENFKSSDTYYNEYTGTLPAPSPTMKGGIV